MLSRRVILSLKNTTTNKKNHFLKVLHATSIRNGIYRSTGIDFYPFLTWPSPVIRYLYVVISGNPIGPLACSF